MELLLVQFLVLVFTGALWWMARRDLSNRALPPPAVPESADTQNAKIQDLEQLCVLLETLTTDLARRVEALEHTPRPAAVSKSGLGADPPKPEPAKQEPETDLDPRHAQMADLVASGVSDPAALARQTGLGRAEVDLLLSLRSRRVL